MAVTEKERDAVIMRLDGRTYVEIGEALGLTSAGAYEMVKRAIKQRGVAKLRMVDTVYFNIANKMQERRMTERELAEAAGMCSTALSRILKGYKDIRLSTASKIASALGLTVDEAFRKEE